MAGLDEYHRYLARQGNVPPPAPTPRPKSRVPEPGTDNNVRYVVRAGITIAIPASELLDDDFQLELEVVEAKPKPARPPAARRPSSRIPAESLKQGVVPEEPRIPPLPPAAPDSGDEAVALWTGLPRQLQILGTMARLEPANGTRSFEETREQLIQRLADPTLTLEETARLLDVCTATVRRYANRGHLSHHRTLGQQRRFRLSDVLQFLERRAERARTHG
ncbi:MAG: helix-turn-helix domain-containing protein [Armatimonadota bacterium]